VAGGREPVTVRTLFRSLARAQERGYRESLSGALFEHVTATRGLALCLYDVTTLYFEAEREDDLRQAGLAKERRGERNCAVGVRSLLHVGSGRWRDSGCSSIY